MNLFRKHKVKKLVAAYVKEHDREIDENLIGYEELVALKELNLEEIAIAYDALDGSSFKGPVISKSCAFPNRRLVKYSTSKLGTLIRRAKHKQFMDKAQFDFYPEYLEGDLLVADSIMCFKVK
jgi:hypothetical protein